MSEYFVRATIEHGLVKVGGVCFAIDEVELVRAKQAAEVRERALKIIADEERLAATDDKSNHELFALRVARVGTAKQILGELPLAALPAQSGSGVQPPKPVLDYDVWKEPTEILLEWQDKARKFDALSVSGVMRREDVGRLVSALEPFAKAAERAESDEADDYSLYGSSARHELTIGHLRNAAPASPQKRDVDK